MKHPESGVFNISKKKKKKKICIYRILKGNMCKKMHLFLLSDKIILELYSSMSSSYYYSLLRVVTILAVAELLGAIKSPSGGFDNPRGEGKGTKRCGRGRRQGWSRGCGRTGGCRGGGQAAGKRR